MTSSLPKTYKQAVFKAAGQPLTIEEVALEAPKKGEVLVRVEACGVCHSDSFAQANGFGAGFPMVPGHESIGHVAAVAEGESRWKVGDRVGGPWHGGHDGTCKACNKGLMQMCDNAAVNGITRNGGYAQYTTLRSEAAVRIPTGISAAKYAPILCAGATTFNSIRKMNIAPGSLVAVQGLGGLGHLAIQYANKAGYRVVALSRDASKEEFARKLGAHEYIDGSKVDQGEALQKLGGASLIIATAPNPKGISPLLKGLGIMGKLLVLTVVGELPVDTITMTGKGLSVHCWPSGHALDCEEAIEFTQLEDVDCMVEEFPLEKANEAFDAMMNTSVRFRAVLTME
ncbi:MAG: hypothetical protein M1831_004734 [Alyxoria varia]|nr:MAG: hypothetical protein M1831_004734 [Alyxoria varia]